MSEPETETELQATRRSPLRRLYDWTLHWARTPYGLLALALVAFAESSFFPIPPDPLLMALCLAQREKALRYAAICTVCSVLGGAFGYWLGDQVLRGPIFDIVEALGWNGPFTTASAYYHHYDAWAVGMAALTPIPYKVFTILAGYLRLDFATFMAASIAGRGGRFFAVGLLFFLFGGPIRAFVERYLNWLCAAFFVLLIGAFLVLGGLKTELQPDRDRLTQIFESLETAEPQAEAELILELQKESGRWFGYNPSGSVDERSRAILRWRNWWREWLEGEPSGTAPPGRSGGRDVSRPSEWAMRPRKEFPTCAG